MKKHADMPSTLNVIVTNPICSPNEIEEMQKALKECSHGLTNREVVALSILNQIMPKHDCTTKRNPDEDDVAIELAFAYADKFFSIAENYADDCR
ncbi:hypothetical protein C1S86_24405 [Vibrio parahaemolyticus]|uniref:hypothetical protein n=1 Tax=Vibrio parahaemolyticus TaxID=670 RepID=UPI000C87B8A6|nr:hypothetical protein [Vibrio parahaemolyticus]PMT73899.1 hypothetical protein C1S97_25325 [Vibrio parahaemolyticus]PMT79099.1 hypothetical protein C1S86_24405 [Vibrio parahaemolyticus]